MPGWRGRLTGGPAKALLSVGVSVGFVFLFLRDTDFGAVAHAFTDANVGLILLALLVFFAGTWFRALRWQYLLRPIVRTSWRRLYPIMAVGYAGNNVLPFRTGEILRAHTLHQQLGVRRAAGLSNVFLERVMDGVMLALFLVVGVTASVVGVGGMHYAGDVLTAAMAFLAFGVSVAVAGLYLVGRHPARAESLLVAGVRRMPLLREHRAAWVEGLVEGVRPAGDRSLLAAAFWTSAFAWGLEALMYFLVGEAFGLDQPFPVYLLVAAAANVIITAPSTSGGVGPFEWAAKEVVLIYLVAENAEETAIAYAAALHGLVLIPITLLGLVFLWHYHVPVGRLMRRGTQELADAPAETGVTRAGK